MLWHHLWNIHLFPHIQMVPLSYTKYIYLILLLTFEYVLYSWVYFNACYNYYNSVICSAMWWNKPPHCTSLNSLYVCMCPSLSCVWLFVTLWTVPCQAPVSIYLACILARILEWVAVAASRGIFLTQGSNPRLLHWQANSLPLSYLGRPWIHWVSLIYFCIWTLESNCIIIKWKKSCWCFYWDHMVRNLRKLTTLLYP